MIEKLVLIYKNETDYPLICLGNLSNLMIELDQALKGE